MGVSTTSQSSKNYGIFSVEWYLQVSLERLETVEFAKLNSTQNWPEVHLRHLRFSLLNIVTFKFQSRVESFLSFTVHKLFANVCPTHDFERGRASAKS